jgi:putative Ca2+/H+ antiporter (TMEM165/GDT1 family)
MMWNTLLSAFGLVFVAELGDKTQLAVLTQTCKYRRPWAVFLGASIALTAVTALGAVAGQVLGQFVPENVLRVVAAIAFVVMGLLLAREAARSAADPASVACDLPEDPTCGPRQIGWRAFASTFGLLFIAEMGDKTQLAVLNLAGSHTAAWPVFLGATLALTGVTALAVVGGEGLRRLVPEQVLRWIAAVAFIIMGVLIGLGVF